MALCWSLDKIGPICRAVDDVALVLAAINGFDAQDHGSIAAPFGWDATRSATGLRVGYIAANFTDGLDLTALDAVRSLGAAAIPLELPDLPYDALRHLLFAEAAAAFEELTLDDIDDKLARQDPGAWPNSFRKARFLSAVDHIQLDRLRRHVMQQMDDLFRRVDVLLAPAVNGPMTVTGNMTGHPCLTIRTGFSVGLSVTPGQNRRSSTTADRAAAGLDGPRALPKGLRHGFGVSADIPLNLVQKWLAHAQLSTRAIYADAVGEEKRGFSVSRAVAWPRRLIAPLLAPSGEGDINYFAARLGVPALRGDLNPHAAAVIGADPHDVPVTVHATDAPDRVVIPVHAHEERGFAGALVADGTPKNQRS